MTDTAKSFASENARLLAELDKFRTVTDYARSQSNSGPGDLQAYIEGLWAEKAAAESRVKELEAAQSNARFGHCGKNMGNDILIIPCDLPKDHDGPCERNIWPVPSTETKTITYDNQCLDCCQGVSHSKHNYGE